MNLNINTHMFKIRDSRAPGKYQNIMIIVISVSQTFPAHTLFIQFHTSGILQMICHRLGLTFDDSLRAREGKKAEGFVIMYRELNRHPENVERYPFIADNTAFYWKHFSNRDSEFFVDETFDLPSFAEAVEAIHRSGGRAFLAHPYAYGMDQTHVEALVEEAVKAGADGIELRHSSNKGDDVEKIKEFARRYSLLLSGGTDLKMKGTEI